MLTLLIILILILLIIIGFIINNPLQFYIKYGIYVLITMIYSFIIIPICLLRPGNLGNAK
jgi:hypothetical protein